MLQRCFAVNLQQMFCWPARLPLTIHRREETLIFGRAVPLTWRSADSSNRWNEGVSPRFIVSKWQESKTFRSEAVPFVTYSTFEADKALAFQLVQICCLCPQKCKHPVINKLLLFHLSVREYKLSTYTKKKGENHEVNAALCVPALLLLNRREGANYKWV